MFGDPKSQVIHFTEHHECEFCIKCLNSLEENRKHVLVEHECLNCGKIFEKFSQREKHILDDHGLHACKYCEKCFPTESEMDDHIFTDHCKCRFCFWLDFDSSQELKEHVLVEHECPICGEYFQNRYKRRDHLLDNHDLHACEHCENYFQTESEVVDHTSLDHFKCNFCTWKQFHSLQETREHVLKEHACPNCGKYFGYQHARRNHLFDDHGLHACRHCEKYFQTESELNNHISTDHFVCQFCSVDFDSLQERREHVLVKHECQICGKCFRYDFEKERHIREEHPNSDFKLCTNQITLVSNN